MIRAIWSAIKAAENWFWSFVFGFKCCERTPIEQERDQEEEAPSCGNRLTENRNSLSRGKDA